MTSNEQHRAFERDLRALIQRYRAEFTLTLGQVVGTLNVVAIQMTMEELAAGGGQADTYDTAKTDLEGLVPQPQALEPPKPALDPVYAACEECGWPGGAFATKELAKEAHNEHAPICFTPTKLWSFPPETREFIESGATLAEVAPPPPEPMPWQYRACPNCSWAGGNFMTRAEAISSHQAHNVGKHCNRRTSSLEIKDTPPPPPAPAEMAPGVGIPAPAEWTEVFHDCPHCGWVGTAETGRDYADCLVKAAQAHREHSGACNHPTRAIGF